MRLEVLGSIWGMLVHEKGCLIDCLPYIHVFYVVRFRGNFPNKKAYQWISIFLHALCKFPLFIFGFASDYCPLKEGIALNIWLIWTPFADLNKFILAYKYVLDPFGLQIFAMSRKDYEYVKVNLRITATKAACKDLPEWIKQKGFVYADLLIHLDLCMLLVYKKIIVPWYEIVIYYDFVHAWFIY